MRRSIRSRVGRWALPWLAVVAAWGSVSNASALTTLFSEDFDGIPLLPSPTYQIPNAWSPDPPSGWDRQDRLPGLNDPSLGVQEFKGWSFWRKDLWQAVANGARQRFTRGQGVVAVADPDTWNDLGNPASDGTYNTFLYTPTINLDGVGSQDNKLVLGFDTSWRGGCCSNNQSDEPNNQTAIIRASVDNGPSFEVLRWESARFRDGQGRPTNDPFDVTGNANTPNPFLFPREFDERIFLDFSDLLTGFSTASSELLSAASESGGNLQFEFAMEDAGDDGWWAVDNIELASYGTLLGDMNLSGDLDLGDYDAFALAMLDSLSYQYAYGGAFPVEHGSLDSEFDFDDIPYFLDLMKGVGPPPAMSTFWSAYAVPEPSSALLLVCMASPGLLRLRGARWKNT